MSKPTYQFLVSSASRPVVEVSPDGIYVWFNRGRRAAKTEIKSRWPVVAVDLDENGEVIGIEHAPAPAAFSLQKLAASAGVRVPAAVAARAQFQQVTSLIPADA